MSTDQHSTVQANTSEVVEHLVGFDGSADAFLHELLRSQCELAEAAGGALVRYAGADPAEVVAVYPPVRSKEEAPPWLPLAVQAMGPASESKGSMALPIRRGNELYGGEAQDQLIVLPMRNKKQFTGVAAFHIPAATAAVIERSRDRLEMTSALLNVFELRQALERRRGNMELLSSAMEVMSTVNGQMKFRPGAMALVNELASRFKAERVSLGMVEGRYVKVQAMSQTEHFTRKMKLVQDIESAMEECMDQDLEVVHPCPPEAPTITRQAKKLCDTHGPTTVVSLPIRAGEESEVVGVLTMEKPADTPPTLREVETLRIACNLVAARLSERYEADKWVGAKFLRDTRKGAAWAVGTRQTWIKLTALGVALVLLLSIFGKGTYRVSAPFVIEPDQRRIVSAPFDAQLLEVFANVNAVVAKGDKLAQLDVTDLNDQLAEANAQLAQYQSEVSRSMSERNSSDERVARAQVLQIEAQIRQIQRDIDQATIVAPMVGVVIQGDLKRREGGPVQFGEELFQVSDPTDLFGELKIPESRISDVSEGQEGFLSSSDRPDRKIGFTVVSIDRVAEAEQGRNIFRVRVRLHEDTELRIGQEGVAKIDVERRPLIWIWTRDAVNWARMKLWI